MTSLGIIAISGSPAAPVQPHIVSGLGDSVMNECSGTVAPLPGNTIGVDGPRRRGRARAARRACRPSASGGVSLEIAQPNPDVRRLWRRMPIAWNGPVIQSSMWLRATR